VRYLSYFSLQNIHLDTISRIERELLHIQTALDLLDDELTTDSIIARERAMDKEFIILIQGACKADNIPRALELAKLLHQLTSFSAAMKIADFYHLPGFREKLEIIKAEREEDEDRLVVMRDKRRRWLKPDPQLRQVQMQGYGAGKIDLLGDVRPPPAIERPGMARVTVPVIETTRYRSVVPPVPPQPVHDETQVTDSPSSTSGEGKRKRVEVDDDDVFGSNSSLPMAPPPLKQSK
jgi:chromosome transmission fidelity protein 4